MLFPLLNIPMIFMHFNPHPYVIVYIYITVTKLSINFYLALQIHPFPVFGGDVRGIAPYG